MFGADGATLVRSQSLQFSNFVTDDDYADYITIEKVAQRPKTSAQHMPWWYIGVPTVLVVMGLIMVCGAIFVLQRRRKFV
jgi:LPXTG-motif cell wall-anchored protein